MTAPAPETIPELQDVIRAHPRISVRGGGSKPALAFKHQDAIQLEIGKLRGIVEYQPEEFTFTALAGTPVLEIEEALGRYGQYLPFDPPLIEAGATLGGATASGLSGAGRYRFGGMRDFILGVRFVDCQGRLVSSGGKVVKNAAGFDLPKLMVGSLGQYGVMVELSFKVFPRPQAFCTAQAEYYSLPQALEDMSRLSLQPLELFALELMPTADKFFLLARLGGRANTLVARVERLRSLLRSERIEVIEGEAETTLWRAEREFNWTPPEYSLVKIPLTLRKVSELDEQLAAHQTYRRYSAGASQAWVAWPGEIAGLDALLGALQLTGLVIRGDAGYPLIGVRTENEFARRVKRALDPDHKFPQASHAT